MKYAVKFSLDTDGFTNWDEDQIEDPDITFSIVRYPSLEDARKAVNQDFIAFRVDIGFYSNDTVKSINGMWLVANDMKMYGGTAVTGEDEAYAVSYEVSGDCDYASMIIESVSPASEEDETHMESDLEEGYVEGVYICTASQPDTANESPTRNNQSLYNTEGLRERLVKKVKDAIIKPTSHPENYSEIDADAINRFDLEILKDIADNGDAEASYLLFQIYGSEEMQHDFLFDEYLEKAALGGFPAAIRPYIIRKEFYRFIDADCTIKWNKDLPFSFEDYNSDNAKYLKEFLDFCENTVNAFPECAEACLEMLNAYIREFWGYKWACDRCAQDILKRDDVYETSEFGVLAMKLAQRVSRFPEALLLPLKETYSEQLHKYTDKDSDPFLGGLSLEKCLEDGIYPDLDYLFDRYGDEALGKVFSAISDLDEEIGIYGAETIKRLAKVSEACATEMQLCSICGVDGFDKEDIFKAALILDNLGVNFKDTQVYEDLLQFEDYGDSDLVLNYFEPELLKKYGLYEIMEHIIHALNKEEFWDWFYSEKSPDFFDKLIPILNDYIAKGSVEAANVLIKAFKAGKESYFADATHFTVPDGVTEIPSGAFKGCKNLTDVVLPEGLKRIEPWAFPGCENLSNIRIPSGVVEIGECAFGWCNSFTDIVLPDGLTEIENAVFACCTELSSITIPAVVNKIGEAAFTGCINLKDIVLPEGLKKIEAIAFMACTKLSSVAIPKGVIKIGNNAFKSCLNLSRVILPIGVKTIHADAFEGCDSLQEIVVPAKKTDYYKKRLPGELWDKIVEMD